jgi:hypothetical protein
VATATQPIKNEKNKGGAEEANNGSNVVQMPKTEGSNLPEHIGNGAPEQNGEIRSIRDIIKDLSKPVAHRHLRTRKQGGKELTYISWYDAVKYFDHYAPGWNYEVRSMNSVGGKLILTVRVSVPCAEGMVYREATGQEGEETNSFGDSSSNAESMALRRCFAKFGLGLYLYEK